jgi:hypothetical protein
MIAHHLESAVIGAYSLARFAKSWRIIMRTNQLPPQIASLILTIKREKPHWGARKIS